MNLECALGEIRFRKLLEILGEYSNTLQRRKTVWGIVMSATLVGVLSRLWFDGISSWLPGP
jgi:hypothetical protein